jgi:formyltetrahydrofolate synthetase
MLLFGVPVVVAINKFEKDTDKEIETVRKIAKEAGALDAVVSEAWAKGGRGTVELARRVAEASRQKSHFRFLYDLNLPIKEKIKIIAVKIYGANGVEYSHLAEEKIKRFTELGFDKLPICMAKTHLSLSHDPKLKGCPVDFVLPIRDMRASIGAGFLYPLCGTMQTMPGLPSIPAGEMIDINKDGKVIGLF